MKPISSSTDASSAYLYTDSSMNAAYVVPATLANILKKKNENGTTYLEIILGNSNLQDKFRRLLTAFSDKTTGSIWQILTVGDTTIHNLCKLLGILDSEDAIKEEWHSMMRKPNKNSLFVVNKSSITNNNSKDVESHKQGGVIRKYAPGGGFAKASGSTASTKQTKTKIQDARKSKEMSTPLDFKWNELSNADKADFAGLIADVASIALGAAPIAGGVTGLGGTAAGLYADIARDGFQWSDLATAGVSGAMDVVSMLPGVGSGVQAAKVVSKLAKKGK